MTDTFIIAIKANPHTTFAANSALEFAKQLKHHQFKMVFFYGDGAYIALNGQTPEDEFNIQNSWLEFARNRNISLPICIATACRRGIESVDKPFKLIGLTEFFDKVNEDCKIVWF